VKELGENATVALRADSGWEDSQDISIEPPNYRASSPADTAAHNHPPFLPQGQVDWTIVKEWGENATVALRPDSGWEESETGLEPPNYRAPPQIPPIRRTVMIIAGAGTETDIGDPYSTQLSIGQDSGVSTGVTIPAAPVFYTSFMPIPSPTSLEHFESTLPLDLSRN
jgi:hypothetical protein